MMTDLSPEARRLLGLARRGDDPAEADRVRVGQHMAKRVALAAGAAGTAFGAAKVASGAAAISGLLGKGLVTGVIVTVTAVGAWKATNRYVARQPAAATRAVVAAGSSQPRGNAVSSKLELGPALAAPTESSVTATSIDASGTAATNGAAAGGGIDAQNEPRPDAAPSPGSIARLGKGGVTATNQPKKNSPSDNQRDEAPAASPAEPSPAEPSFVDDSKDPLLAETAALREVQRAMTSGQAERALGLLREQNAQFGAGALNQERAAAEVFALCSLARITEARERAEAFERHWPRSPMIARVRRACDQSTRTP